MMGEHTTEIHERSTCTASAADVAASEATRAIAAPVPVPEAGAVSTQTVTGSMGSPSQGWISTNLRNGVVITLTITICYLAYVGVADARMALVNAFMVLAGALFGERASLKVPGRDA